MKAWPRSRPATPCSTSLALFQDHVEAHGMPSWIELPRAMASGPQPATKSLRLFKLPQPYGPAQRQSCDAGHDPWRWSRILNRRPAKSAAPWPTLDRGHRECSLSPSGEHTIVRYQ